MSVFRTEHGFLVVSDQNGDSMIVEFNIARVLRRKEEPSK